MLQSEGKQLFQELSLCTDCGVDKFVEGKMASVGVGIPKERWDKICIMQLIMKTEMCIDYSACCSMSSFGLDYLLQDHIINFSFFALQNVGF